MLTRKLLQKQLSSTAFGGLYSWGTNTNGQLGSSNYANASSPIQVGSLSWISISAGTGHTVAIRSDNTLWAWGLNSSGQLGINLLPLQPRSSPTQVGSLSWNLISAGPNGSHTMAIRSDNTLWAWGYNNVGQLGLGDVANRSSPVQVGTSSWLFVSAGGIHTLAIRSDYTLWAWGYNLYGQLGIGDVTNRSSPVQVGTSNWTSVSAGALHTMAIRSNNTLWGWGYNAGGRVGDNTQTNRSSPTQIGTSNWVGVSAGSIHTIGIKKI